MFSRYEIDEHNRIEDAKKQGRTIAHTGTLYGVRQETLEAYVAAERKKVWEEAANILEASLLPSSAFSMRETVIDYYRQQAAKETP